MFEIDAELEDTKLENVLQQIFKECDASSTVLDSMVPMNNAVSVSRIVEYIQDRLPTWSIDDLAELWKCLVAISTNGCVNLHQFKEGTKHWIIKMQQVQPTQNSSNDTRKELVLLNDADSSMKIMDKDIMEFELRVKLRELHEENVVLRDELERQEGLIDNLKQQHSITEKQLERYIQKCHQLEKENDEQRDQLNELIQNDKTKTMSLQSYTKEHQSLLKKLEAAELEMQVIPVLKEKLEKISKEKMECIRQFTRMQEELDEKENECKQLKTTITELTDSNLNMKETYEYTIHNLREKNHSLADENMELQSLSAVHENSIGDRFSTSIISDMDVSRMHSTPYKKVLLEDSLYAELKASCLTDELLYSRNSYRQELQEELDEYNAAIFTTMEQLEKIIQIFIMMRNSTDNIPEFNLQDTDTRANNVDILKRKAAFLLNMATEEITRRNTRRDSSTQLRADPANADDSSNEFGIRSFRDLLSATRLYPKAEADLRSITLRCMNENDHEEDSFLRIIKTYAGVQSRFRIVEPIIEELHDIIESLDALANRKDHPLSENSRHRSIYTLPSSLQSEDSKWLRFGCQTSFVAQGDGLMQKDCEEKPALAEASNVSDQENPICSEENRSSEMPKVSSLLQVDSKALTTSEEEETNMKSFQVPEVSSASTPVSPRRKISVYYRSFDVVAVQDQHEAQPGSNLEVRQLPSNLDDSPMQIDKTAARDRNSLFNAKYPFGHTYRNIKSDSDSSSNSTPLKQSQDSPLHDEPPVLRKIHLAPTRLKFSQKARNELNRTEVPNYASPITTNSTESDISESILTPLDGECKKDAAYSSSTSAIDKNKMEFKKSDDFLMKKYAVPCRYVSLHDQTDLAKTADSEDPHSQASVQRDDSESQSRIERPVDSQMSSREDSLTGSDSTCIPATGSDDRRTDEKVENEVGTAANVVSSTSLSDSVSRKVVPCKTEEENDEKTSKKRVLKPKRFLSAKRSRSEGENLGRSECRCKRVDTPLISRRSQRRVFPSLVDDHLQESGLNSLSEIETERRENLSEFELQKRYIAFSLCLCIDRLTLPQRVAMSLRQRDQSEKNLSCEVQKMQQGIQELAPLCTDRESAERVERVRHQLDMIVRCAHKVSCAAETLGAVHQERRVSRAVLLADRYLHVLQSRCEKLSANVTETKRILVENNIVIEENSGELNDELPRMRYRSGTPANNRMMMARRRASVATMSRPMGSTQDVIKDTVRQRNSVSGRMTLRRPSFSSESPKWELEKMDRTESSNSISELRGIFEQAESRRSSREENNNMLRLSHSNSPSGMTNCAIIDDEIWTDTEQETFSEHFVDENINLDNRSRPRFPSHSFELRRRKTLLWYIIPLGVVLFFLGFLVNQVMSVINSCNNNNRPLNKWLIEYIFGRYFQTRNAAPYPM
ncbi:hypothetical protein P5V15_002212 [Pogonomyrmex californicus]